MTERMTVTWYPRTNLLTASIRGVVVAVAECSDDESEKKRIATGWREALDCRYDGRIIHG